MYKMYDNSAKLSVRKWKPTLESSSVQFSSVAQSCPTLCNPMNLLGLQGDPTSPS